MFGGRLTFVWIMTKLTHPKVCMTFAIMNLERGGKLKMGPVLDFDWAFGGTTLFNAL